MESKHVSSDIKHEVKIEVISKDDFNVRFKEEIVKEELVENEHSSEYVGDNSCPEQIRGETWCMPDLIKLEDFSSEDNREIEVPQLIVDEDKKALKKLVEGVTGHEKHLQDCSEDPTDTAGCEDVKIEDEIDIKYEDVKTQTDEEESNEDKTDLGTLLQFDAMAVDVTSASNDDATKLSSSTGETLLNLHNKSDLISHKRIRLGEKSFHCRACSKYFSKKHCLVKHEKIHLGIKPFHCTICSKCFLQKQNMLRHKKTHTGERSFQCEICSKFFCTKQYLVKHKIIHTRETPFHCEVCSKYFSRKQGLARHEKTHLVEKPFECGICLKLFRLKFDLKMHEKTHTREKLLYCRLCSKTFIENHICLNMREHIKRKKQLLVDSVRSFFL